MPAANSAGMGGFLSPARRGMLRSPEVLYQMLDPLDPLTYELCFPGGLSGETEIACPHCHMLLTVPVNDPNGEESYQCCKCQKGFVVDWAGHTIITNANQN